MQLDAYTLRKMAPRLLIAVIALNLSIYLCLAAVDLTNIFGKGLGQLLTTPFNDAKVFDINLKGNVTNSIVGGAGVLVGAGLLGTVLAALFSSAAAAGALAAGGALIAGLLPFLFLTVVSIGLVALSVLLTVIVRQGLLVFLVVVSPIAIALFVLPGTEKFFRQWWDIFLKTLMVYPIIAAIFAMSDILGAIIMKGATADSVTGIAGLAIILTGIVVIYAPLFLIPFAFKFAGGLLGAISNIAAGQAGKGKDGLRQRIRQSAQDPNSWLGGKANRAKETRGELGLTGGVLIGGGAKALGALGRGKGISGARSAFGTRRNAMNAQKALLAAKKAQEHELMQVISGDDDISKVAALGGNREAIEQNLMRQESGRFGTGAGTDTAAQIANRAEAADLIGRMQGKYGDSVRKLIAQEEYSKSTTAFKGEHGSAEMLEMAEDVGASRLLSTRALINMKSQQKAIAREAGMASTSKLLGLQMEYAAGPRDDASQAKLEEKIIDSAIEKASPSQLATMDANGLARVSRRINHRLKEAGQGVVYDEDGKQTVLRDDAVINADAALTDAQKTAEKESNQNRRQAAIQMEVAHAANLRDSLNYASPENRRKLAPVVFSEKVQGKGLELTERDARGNIIYEDAKDDKGNVIYNFERDALGVVIKDAAGKPKFTNEPVQIPKKRERTATLTELVSEMENNPAKYATFDNARKTWGARGDEENRQQQQRQQQGP